MVIQHMEQFEFLNNRNKRTSNSLKKALEKLSSGYDVNRSADDAASLAISEKLRSISAGLEQGVDNINDGISYTRSVDGASQEINDILHRLKGLAAQSANGTYDGLDRNAIDLEYQQLLEEIGQITDTSNFNGLPLFDKHMETYGLKEGFVQHTQPITIDGTNDTLNIGYTLAGAEKEYVVKIPHGTYSAEELADKIDTELYESAPNLIIGLNKNKEFTMQAEPGSLGYIGGSGAGLFYDAVVGSAEGHLLGVTVFQSDNAKLKIESGANDVMSFRVGNNDDTVYSITLDPGRYNRQELVDHINSKIASANIPGEVRAVAQNNAKGERIIGLASKQSITGLAGNFIKMDGYTSPIYDICCYGYNDNSQAEITGKKVLASDIEVKSGKNDYFTLALSYYGDDASQVNKEIRIDLLDDGEYMRVYSSPNDFVQRINDQLGDIPFTAELDQNNCLKITSDQYGDKCKADLVESKTPSGHMIYDYFWSGTLKRVTPTKTDSEYRPASFTSKKDLGTSVDISDGENELSFTVTSDSGISTVNITIPAGTYSASSLQQTMNNAIATGYPDLADKLQFTVGKNISLAATEVDGADIKSITASSTASAYDKLIRGKTYQDSSYTYAGKEEVYSSLSGTNPLNGHNAVHTTPGKETDVVSYKDQTTSSPQRQGNYINYSPAYVTAKNGYEEEIENDESFVADETVIKYPATLRMENVLTQFTTTGKSLRDLNLKMSIDSPDGKKDFDINIPKGSTASEALKIINNKLGSSATASSDGSSLVITSAEKGKDVLISFTKTNICNTASKNSLANTAGAVIDEALNRVYVPASMNIPNVGSHMPLTVDGTNDLFVLKSGSKTYNLKLAHKTYTSASEVADELNRLMTEADGGNQLTKAKANGNAISFAAPAEQTGSISVGSSSTCLIGKTKVVADTTGNPHYNPATNKVENPAQMRIESFSSHFPLTVDSTNNTLTFNYSSPGNSDEKITIVIPDGTYNTPQDAANKINEVIQNDPDLKDKISANYVGGSNPGLVFETVGGGDGYGLSNPGGTSNLDKFLVKKNTSGSNGKVDEENNVVRYPAGIVNEQFSTLFNGKGLTIDSANNHVALNVNGRNVEFDLADGVYSGTAGRNSIISQIEAGLAGSGASLVRKGTVIDIATDDGGSGVSINKTGANTSPIFKKAVDNAVPVSLSRIDNRCQIIGGKSIGSVKITGYNNSMKFSYSSNGASGNVEISVPEGEYTAAGLAAAMQQSIDDKIGSGELTVFVSGGKFEIKGAGPSDTRSFNDFEGGLFETVFQGANYTVHAKHSEKNGATNGGKVSYIVGRNDLRPINDDEMKSGKNVTIYTGLNDQVAFDFHYNNNVYEIEFRIPPGNYTSDELAKAVEAGGRGQLALLKDENGNSFPVEFFNASIGLGAMGIPENNTGISSGDKLVLWCKMPDDGTHDFVDVRIDGVRGNSAYRIFYDATKSPQPSTFVGKPDLSHGIIIEKGQNDTLEYWINGVPETIEIPSGRYAVEELATKMNEIFENSNSIIRAGTRNGHLMFYTIENDEYVFDRFRGNAAKDLIYGGEGRDSDKDIDIHTGRRTNSYITFKKTRVDEHLMRINTTGITDAQRALKALNRLEGANRYLVEYRALSGANENRSEHALARTQTYLENLIAADSGLRDTDVAEQTAMLKKQQIMMQVQQSMFDIVKQHQSSVLDIIT